MNELLEKLNCGDLTSDGRANEVVDDVIQNPKLINNLIDGLNSKDDVIRGRTADALEKISRSYPQLLNGLSPLFEKAVLKDKVPMVRWHMAMIFPNLILSAKETKEIIDILFRMLDDESVFVKTWAISSLTIFGRRNKNIVKKIIKKITPLLTSESVAVKSRVVKALKVLENENEDIPKGWIKRKE